jgi:hypothetical protein
MDIPAPTLPEDDPRRDDECERAVGMAVAGLWEFFEDAGWGEDEFDRALLAVANAMSARARTAEPGASAWSE